MTKLAAIIWFGFFKLRVFVGNFFFFGRGAGGKPEKLFSKLAIPILFEVAIILRLWNLGYARFWYDEAFTAVVSRLHYLHMLQATAGDTHPPLYYTLTWLLTYLGAGDEFGLRLLSASFSIWALFSLYLLCKEANLPRSVTIATVALMATAPVQINYAQEARMYSFLTWLIIEAVRSLLKQQYFRMAIYGTALMYTQNYAVFYWPVIGILAIARALWSPVDLCRERWGQLLAAIVAPVVIFIPWALVLLGQMQIVQSGYWIQPPTPGAVIWMLFNLWWGFSVPTQLQAVALLSVIGIFGYCLVRGLQHREYRIWLWLGLAPLVLALVASLVWKPLLMFRGLLGTLPFLYILLAALLFGQVQFTGKRLYVFALLGPVTLVGLVFYYLYSPATKSGGALVTEQMILMNWQEGDAIATVNDTELVLHGIYTPEIPMYHIDGGCRPALGALSFQTRKAIGIRSLQWSEITRLHKRVWVMGGVGPMDSACQEKLHAQIVNELRQVLLVTSTPIATNGVWLYENDMQKTGFSTSKKHRSFFLTTDIKNNFSGHPDRMSPEPVSEFSGSFMTPLVLLKNRDMYNVRPVFGKEKDPYLGRPFHQNRLWEDHGISFGCCFCELVDSGVSDLGLLDRVHCPVRQKLFGKKKS